MTQPVSFEDEGNDMTFEDVAPISDAALSQVATLANRQLAQEREVVRIEAKLKEAKQRLRLTCESDLPLLMSEIGLSSIALTDGTVVEIDEKLYATVAKKNKKAAAQWLIDNGQGSIVKTEVALQMSTGEQEKLHRLVALLDSTEFSEYSLTSSVHTGTLKSVINELLEQGVDVPLDLFGAHFAKKSIIK